MASFLKATHFIHSNNKLENHAFPHSYNNTQRLKISTSVKPPMAALSTTPTVGLSETFTRLRKQGKVALIPYITAGDPDMSTTAEALKVLDRCGSDIIELGVPYSDPLADGPVIQAAATRSLSRGTNFAKVLSMLKDVVPQLSCPIALFTYYNPILKRGTEKFMATVRDAGVHGLVVPDVPLEETEILRKEAARHNIELMSLKFDRYDSFNQIMRLLFMLHESWSAWKWWTMNLFVGRGWTPISILMMYQKEQFLQVPPLEEVLLTTPTTPTIRMKAITEASEGFVYLVSSIGVTGARESVSSKVQSLLIDIKEATSKPVAVGFGISKPEHVKQVAGWGADGVIVGSAMVRILGEAKSPEEGLKELEVFATSLKSALS